MNGGCALCAELEMEHNQFGDLNLKSNLQEMVSTDDIWFAMTAI